MSSVEIHQWVTRGQELLVRVTSTIEEAPSLKIRSLAVRLPKNVTPAEGSVNVLFAGQYSAGKSSILKAMTGREDIEVGAGIVTEQAREYDWNGIRLVDTPGVHTEIRPDHDAVTYEAISSADLLVFVVTNELFDSYLVNHFRKLAVDQDKAHEMMLVVNKMQRCAGGNTLVAQAVIREDLRKVLAPFSPEKLRTSFIDAEAAMEADLEADRGVVQILRRKSGFAAFTDGLNEFVREQGLASRYTTALYTVEQVLQEALAAEPSGDLDVDALRELLVQERHALLEARDQLRRSIDNHVQPISAKIRKDGREIADLIHASCDPEQINHQLRDAQTRVENSARELAEDIQRIIERYITDLGDRVKHITESVVAKELFSRLTSRIELADQGVDPEALANARKAADVTEQLGRHLIKWSFNPKSGTFAGLFKLNQYSGTAAHDSIKTLGHLFGKSFKPWEAVKLTRLAANTGRVLAVAGTALSIYLQIKEDNDATKLEAELRESRVAARACFCEVAYVIEKQFDQATNDYMSQSIGRRLKEVDEQLEELRNMQQTRSDLSQALMQARDDTRMLIREMHGQTRKPV